MQQPRRNLSSYSLPLFYKLISFHLLMWLPEKLNLQRLPLTSFCPELKIVKNLLYSLQQKTASGFQPITSWLCCNLYFLCVQNFFFFLPQVSVNVDLWKEKGHTFCFVNWIFYYIRGLPNFSYIFVSECCGKQYEIE